MSAPRKQQVSLRGASAKEITRDALLEKVSQERELRNYIRRSTAAVLLIQSVWRRHCCMKNVAAQLHDEWESLANLQNVVMTGRWLSSNLLRPFIFFVTLHQKWKTTNVKCMLTCFRILLQSINSSEPKKNFCSLAIGTPEEKSIWLFQSRKLASICSLILAEFDPMCHPNEDTSVLTSLAMQLLVALTDPKGWKISNDENIRDVEVAVKKLIKFMTVTSDLYSCIRRYILKFSGRRKSSVPTEDHLLITASAVTLALRPFHFAKLLMNDLNHLDFGDAITQYCTFLLTVPSLAQCLPAVLVPALKHESVLSPCLNNLLISKGKVFVEMSKLDQSKVSDCGLVAIPCAAWALSNLINLATEYSNGSGDSSGQFVRGLDCRLYLRSVISITESVLSWLQNAGQIRKETVAHLHHGESSSESSISDICERGTSLGSSVISYVDLFKPVHQQWHLTSLLAMVKKDGTPAANEKFGSLRRLELLDIAYFYSYMLQIFLSLNHLGGSLPILNMLSFTPGFIVELWTTLESLIFSGKDHNFKDCRSSSPGISGAYNNRVSEKRAGQAMKDEGNKWATVLQKITGKSSYEVDFAHSFSGPSGLNQVDDEASDLWDVEPVRRGPEGISKDISCLLHLFCATYGHLLLVLDDIEFYEKQVPFKLEQQRSITAMLNTFVYNGISLNNGQQNKPLMDATIRCLHLLYERNCRHGFCPPSLWVAPARKGRPPIAAAARAHEVAVSINLRSGEALTSPSVGSILSITPHVFPFEERVQMFREFIKLDKVSRRMAGEVGGPGPGSVEVVVRRDHILDDGFRQLKSVGTRLKSTINVSFVSESGLPEAGLDYGGLSKEFLTDISRKAFDPGCGLFSQTSTSERSLIPNTASKFRENGIQMIEFVGQIVGKALYEGILLDYSFSVVFVQKLLGRYSFLDELSTLDPELYRNLIYVKHYDGDVRDISLDFTITEELNGKLVVSELKPGGKSVTVTNENKLQYVHALADYKLNRQILPFANAFYRGLVDLISPSWLSLFNANEFNQLLSGGKHDFDVDDLKNNTRYTGGYSEGSRTIKLFWEVITGFEPKERCMLLKFVTSCSRAPLLGFKHLQPTFTIHKVACEVPLWAMIGGQDVDRLPSASTCYNTLKLPTYKRSNTLRSKLLYAISSNAGFELS